MAYVGNQPSGNFVQVTSQTITGNGGATYTLDRPAGNSAELEVFVNNVRQDPASYSVTGTSLTLGGNIASTDSCYVVFQSAGIGTVSHPAINNLQAADGTFSGNIAGQALTATTGTFSGDLTVDTNTLHVDAANNRVGVGVAAPDVHLHIQNDTNPRFRVEDTTNNVKFDVLAQNSDVKMGNNSNHDLRIITNNSERLRVLSGGGLTFNGDTAAANALDDYEEGTWTPTYDSGFPSGSPEEVNLGCKYTKIGNIVHVSGRIQARNDGTNMQLGGLPFAVASTSSASCDVSADFHTAKKERVYEGTSVIRWTFSSTTPSLHNFYFQATYRTG